MDNPDLILAFLQAECPGLQFTEILSNVGIEPHNPEAAGNGWVRIQTICALGSSIDLWDIEVRWTTNPQIQQQQLVDWGWQKPLEESEHLDRHRLICYLCDPVVGNLPMSTLPPEFLLGHCWRSVLHLYTTTTHPFAIPPLDIRQNYSTTLNLTTTPPPSRAAIETALWQTAGSSQIETGGLRTQGLFKIVPEDQIFLSIITVVYNGEKYLEQTIQSVLQQSYAHLEYIIIDGGSTDGTLDIIRKYEGYINYWVSDRDEGIYHAMNKGSRLASGSHVLHLNADDLLFASDCLDFLRNADPLRNYMNAILKLDIESGVVTKDAIGPAQGDLRDNAFHQNPWFKISRVGMTHPGFVGLLNENSLFPEQYKIMSDTIMLARKFEREPVEVSKRVLTIFRSGGASADNRQVLAEMGQEIKAASGLWQKLLVWLKLQGIFVFEGDRAWRGGE
jgi:hypothetical protein